MNGGEEMTEKTRLRLSRVADAEASVAENIDQHVDCPWVVGEELGLQEICKFNPILVM